MLRGHIRDHSNTHCYFLFCFQSRRDGLKPIPDNGRSAASWFKNKVLSCTTGFMVSGCRMDWIEQLQRENDSSVSASSSAKQWLHETLHASLTSCQSLWAHLHVSLRVSRLKREKAAPISTLTLYHDFMDVTEWQWYAIFHALRTCRVCEWRRTTSRILTFKHLQNLE